jgi:hypothetical protein
MLFKLFGQVAKSIAAEAAPTTSPLQPEDGGSGKRKAVYFAQSAMP